MVSGLCLQEWSKDEWNLGQCHDSARGETQHFKQWINMGSVFLASFRGNNIINHAMFWMPNLVCVNEMYSYLRACIIALHCITLHYPTLHCIALHYINIHLDLHCVILLGTRLLHTTLHYMTWHDITFITLHRANYCIFTSHYMW